MVGGGSLSLPFAFQKSGNALVGPIFLLLTAVISEFCFHSLISASRAINPVGESTTRQGNHSFETIAVAAFGPKAHRASTLLVLLMCFFGCVAYAVLLRDMLQPVTDAVFPNHTDRWLHRNVVMMTVALFVTPLCTLKTLTALKKFGAASMCAVLVLGLCVVIRSTECAVHSSPWHQGFQLFPSNWRNLLDAFPIFISCYVCHYNLLPVHNELRQPSQKRVNTWIRSTTWSATAFYFVIGVAGSVYGPCTPSGLVQGNILLDFDEKDPLLLMGRLCLALTISMAFPMLAIPARDIVIRALPVMEVEDSTSNGDGGVVGVNDAMDDLREPLLEEGVGGPEGEVIEIIEEPWPLRLLVVVLFFWTAVGIASGVSSIDVVWDLLGSTLSILLSYVVPCGAYVFIQREDQSQNRFVTMFAWALMALSGPLMLISTLNAVYNMINSLNE